MDNCTGDAILFASMSAAFSAAIVAGAENRGIIRALATRPQAPRVTRSKAVPTTAATVRGDVAAEIMPAEEGPALNGVGV